MDLLHIKDLEVWTHLGVPKAERAQEQQVLVSLTLSLDTKRAAKEDILTRVVNYEALSSDIRKLAAKGERRTIERLAKDIANLILKKYKPESVTVTVKKFPLPSAQEISITITRP